MDAEFWNAISPLVAFAVIYVVLTSINPWRRS